MLGVASDGIVALRAPHPSEQTQRARCLRGGGVQANTDDPEFVNEAAKRGIFGYVTDGDLAGLRSAIDIVLRRFAEFQQLEGAFGRRALTERAKGILMERHQIDEQAAFEILRAHSRQTGRKLVDVAEAIVDSYLMLPRGRSSDPQPPVGRD